MPALNIKFTDAELARLRSQAKAQHRPMAGLAHDLIVERSDRASHDDIVMAASARVIGLSRDLLKRLEDR